MKKRFFTHFIQNKIPLKRCKQFPEIEYLGIKKQDFEKFVTLSYFQLLQSDEIGFAEFMECVGKSPLSLTPEQHELIHKLSKIYYNEQLTKKHNMFQSHQNAYNASLKN